MAIAQSQEEEKNKRIAAGLSIGLHVLILLFLLYMLAWKAPGPQAPEMGIELNFGMDAVGSGDIQTTANANESENTQDSKPAPTEPDPVQPPDPQPVAQPTPPAQPVETPKVVTTTADAPVTVKEEVKPQPKTTPPKEVVKEPTPKAQPIKEVAKKEPEKPRSLYPGKPTESNGNGKAGSANEATGNNNGDDAGKVGDKGSPEGKLDAKALYGKSGGGSEGLNMPGWRYDIEPQRDPYNNETGVVKFNIKIDADGNIVSVTQIESNVSPQVAAWYRNQLQKTTFSRTGSGAANVGASGTVTFVIRSR